MSLMKIGCFFDQKQGFDKLEVSVKFNDQKM